MKVQAAPDSTLAWVDSAGDQFVFVNRRGLLDRDLQLGDLTDYLHGGNAHVLDDYDMPLLDRVSDRMVQNAHSRITLEAHRDELTTLLNRKAYERALDKLLDKARNADSSHCALLVDLDGFRMLNSAFGIDGGDRLLRRIARVLEEVLDDEEAVIARHTARVLRRIDQAAKAAGESRSGFIAHLALR